jgi:hypothetical protein
VAGVAPQYELLRQAALGNPLPPEARAGLLLFVHRGMWEWARAMSDLGASVPRQQRCETPLDFPTVAEPSAVIHIFAAMAMHAAPSGARP